MSVFMDVLNLLTHAPGGMVYYLILMFSVWAIVGLALSRWSRGERRDIVPRILFAGALMSFSRFLIVVVALLDRQHNTILVSIGPPLERFVDALSALLVCWAFVTLPRQRTLGRVFLGVTGLFSIGLYVIAATTWYNIWSADPSSAFNLSWQRWLWEIWQLIILIPALVYLAVSPAPEKGTLIVSLGVLVVGHLLQAVMPFEQQIPNFSGWVRFANLLAFPLLAASTYQIIVQRFDAQADSLQSISQDSLSQITGLMALLDTTRKMSSSLDQETVLDDAIRGVSQTLQSNLCALALSVSGSSEKAELAGDMELAIVYNASEVIRPRKRFYAAEYPAIQLGAGREQPIVLEPNPRGGSGLAADALENDEESSRIARIYRLLGSEQNGPLIVQPLRQNSISAGVMLVCRPGQPIPFTSAEARKSETLAVHITAAIENARRHLQTRQQIEQLRANFRLLKTEYTRTKADLENRLKQGKEESTVYIQKLYEAETGETRAQNDARELRQKLGRLREETEAEIRRARAEMQQSAEQVARLEETVQALEQEKGELQFQLATAITAQSDAGTRPLAAEMQGSFAGLIDQMASGLILCDQDGVITHINPAGTQLLGRSKEELLGKPAIKLWNHGAWQSAFREMMGQRAVARVPAESTDSAGETRPMRSLAFESFGHLFLVEIAPLLDADRQVGMAISVLDIQKADERIRARDEFLASLAQDLRTPMTSILGYTELLMNESVGKLGGIQRKFLQRVQANVERMRGMLNDLIGVTAIDSGKLAIEIEPVDMVSVIETALRKAQFRLEEKELTTHLEMDELPLIMADPECVQQIVDNLLTNACKSSRPSSTIAIQANVATDDLGNSHLHVSVADTGGGIAPQDQARVFDRFYRAENALIAGLGETGVGLAIVKSLVEAHHGQVWHESEANVGTTFHFMLPLTFDQEADGHGPPTEAGHPLGGNGRG
jgi:PAS domain S-box-containing protein